MTRALITGIRGQDGSYLAELLLAKGYSVHGITRAGTTDLGCSRHLAQQITLHRVAELSDWQRIVADTQPQELYHFAADSFVPSGWEQPLKNLESNTGITIRLLEAVRHHSPETKFLNACSREVFGQSSETWANEDCPMQPTTPYGINKAASRWMTHAYRDRHGTFATNAILFNHESPRRSVRFVTRKVTRAVAEFRFGRQQKLELGSLSARRDWGFAGDFVDAMWRMLQHETPDDFVVGTGVTHSIEDLVSIAFTSAGLDWRAYVSTVPQFARPNDSACLAADTTKAKSLLNWTPQVTFGELVTQMVHADCEALEADSGRSAA